MVAKARVCIPRGHHLSLEAVFAAIAGAWLLDESLDLPGYFGCALIFIGMLAAQLWPRQDLAVAVAEEIPSTARH